MYADPDYCLAETYILADAAIAAVASSIWDREIQGSQDSLCGPHSRLPQAYAPWTPPSGEIFVHKASTSQCLIVFLISAFYL